MPWLSTSLYELKTPVQRSWALDCCRTGSLLKCFPNINHIFINLENVHLCVPIRCCADIWLLPTCHFVSSSGSTWHAFFLLFTLSIALFTFCFYQYDNSSSYIPPVWKPFVMFYSLRSIISHWYFFLVIIFSQSFSPLNAQEHARGVMRKSLQFLCSTSCLSQPFMCTFL